jgi:hypothetical protein
MAFMVTNQNIIIGFIEKMLICLGVELPYWKDVGDKVWLGASGGNLS